MGAKSINWKLNEASPTQLDRLRKHWAVVAAPSHKLLKEQLLSIAIAISIAFLTAYTSLLEDGEGPFN